MILIENYTDVKIIKEAKANEKPKFIIEGVFAQANKTLKNPHLYPKPLLEREVLFFDKTYIQNGIAWGELGHRDDLNLMESNTALIVNKLEWDGDNLLGKATVLDNEKGKIYISMCEAGKPGVSTRGGGDVRNGIVQNNYRLLFWDAVGRPSAESVMKLMTENIDYLNLSEIDYDTFKKIINKDRVRASVVKEGIVDWFNTVMNKKYN